MNALSLRLDWVPWGVQAPIFLAAEKGWFKKAGIDVEIVDGNGSAITVQRVAAHQFDVGLAALSTMAFARGKGLPVISIAGFFRKGDIGLLVPRNSPVESPKDLAGKRIAYTAGSLEAPFIDAFLAAGGLKRNQVQLLNVDAGAKVATYLSGNVGGVFSSAPFALPLVEAKRPSRAMLFSDAGLNLPSFGLFTTTSELREKGPALKRLASIVAGSWAYVVAGHVDEAADAMMRQRPQAKLQPALLRAQIKQSIAFLYTPASAKLPIGFQATEDWTNAIAVMEKAGMITPGSQPSHYFTNDYLDPALFHAVSGD
ncbi:MAG TPA: ABC transporter substrate-binding protein [Alphaproteobacteria bacterium]|nr:ABC transporter substrate-binding protein [Alphaproteobacteria bacterium]